MIMLNNKLCCGCTACQEICPKHCIIVQPNEYGFYKPKINIQQCVKCGLCQKVCPQNNYFWKNENSEKCIYLCVNKNEQTRVESSSGGVYPELAKQIIKKEGYVYGCALCNVNNSWKVKHIEAQSIEALKATFKSKYVQSDLNSSFSLIKSRLNNNKWVLFSGCPCQIAGLKNFLSKDYNKLFLVDFVCHGVPSLKTFQLYIDFLEKKSNKKISKIDFRTKRLGWSNMSIEITFIDRSSEVIPANIDSYYRAFLSNMGLNQACYHCQYNRIPRSSDITLGDFWKVDEVLPNYKIDDWGTSFAIINTSKGRSIFEEVQYNFNILPVTKTQILKGNPFLNGHCASHPRSDKFLKEIKSDNFNIITDKLLKPTKQEWLLEILQYKYLRFKNIVINIKCILIDKINKNYRRQKLQNTDFSIISNNCWGGFIYQYFGLKYNSPTIGLYIPGNDFVKFCSRLDYYLDQELFFIPWEKSSRYELLKDKSPYPIAKLDDIEIYFMHYSTSNEAKEKWNRRKSRINRNHILFKLSQRENCSKQDIENFIKLPLKNKICFSYDKVDGAIHVPELKDFVGDEMPIVSKYYDIIKLINNL